MKIEKIKLRILTETLIFLSFIALWFSGTILKSILPIDSPGRQYLRPNQSFFLGLNRSQWLGFHSLGFNLLLALLLSRIWIDWNYVKKIPKNLKKMMKGESLIS